jgi:cyclopropane-fatty-acyl-phospholipid synthase
VSLRNDPDHYAQTCEAWRAGLEANLARAGELVGESIADDYRRYLEVTVEHFRRRHLALLRIVYERI